MSTLSLFSAILATLAIWFWLRARSLQHHTALPRARLIYDDASAGRPLERALVSHHYRLTGRPDFLLERGDQILPVEAKPLRMARSPYSGDVLQLAAYCLLVEDSFGGIVPAGILRYADRSWEIPFTSALRTELLATLDAMDLATTAGGADRDHDHPARCGGCSMRSHCEQSLE